jgi:hypothetical protein
MKPLTRRERIAVALWLLVGTVAWNGLYDVFLLRSTREYLYRQALHQAGRGPVVDLSQAMGVAVRDAVWLSTLWVSIVLLVAMLTLKLMQDRTLTIR